MLAHANPDIDSRQQSATNAHLQPVTMLRLHAEQIINNYLSIGRTRDFARSALESIFKDTNYNVEVLSENNNKVYKISDRNNKEASIVVVFSRRNIATEMAISQLIQNSVPWLPKSYGTLVTKAVEFPNLDPGSRDFQKDHPFPTEQVECLISMEFLPERLTDRISKAHEKPNNDALISLAQNVGCQISLLLSSLRRNKMVWTDMKHQNFLLDQNHLIVGDTKAFFPVDMLPMEKRSPSDGTLCIRFDEVTGCYLSKDFFLNRKRLTNRQTILDDFELEYSYQLGVILYKILTKTERFSETNKPEAPFVYDHVVFSTEPAGKRLKIIIQKLTDPDSSKRISHSQASRLLQCLYEDEQRFDAELNNVGEREAASSDIDPLIKSRIAIAVKYSALQYDLGNEIDAYKKEKSNDLVALKIYNVYTDRPVASLDQFNYDQDIFKGRLGKKLKHIITRLQRNKITPKNAFDQLQELSLKAEIANSNDSLENLVKSSYRYNDAILELIVNKLFLNLRADIKESFPDQFDLFSGLPMDDLYAQLYDFVSHMRPLVHKSTARYSHAILNYFIKGVQNHPAWIHFFASKFPGENDTAKANRLKLEEKLAKALLSHLLNNMQRRYTHAKNSYWLPVQVKLVKKLMGLDQDKAAVEASLQKLRNKHVETHINNVINPNDIIGNLRDVNLSPKDKKAKLLDSIKQVESSLYQLHVNANHEAAKPGKITLFFLGRKDRIDLLNKCSELLRNIDGTSAVDNELKLKVLNKMAKVFLNYIKKKYERKLDLFFQLYTKNNDKRSLELLKAIIRFVNHAMNYTIKKNTHNKLLKAKCDKLYAQCTGLIVEAGKFGEDALSREGTEKTTENTEDKKDSDDEESIRSLREEFYQATNNIADTSPIIKDSKIEPSDDESSSDDEEEHSSSSHSVLSHFVDGFFNKKSKPKEKDPTSKDKEKIRTPA